MSDKILPGTESVVRYPNKTYGQHLRGVDTYGRQKIKGVSCIKISKNHGHPEAAKAAGYTIVKIAESYAYVVEEPKP